MGRYPGLAATGEPGAVPVEGHAHAPGRARPGLHIGRPLLTVLLLKVAGCQRLEQHLLAAHALSQGLAGAGDMPGLQPVLHAELVRLHAARLGQPIHVRLDGEAGLGHAEATEGAIGRRVGAVGHRVDPYRLPEVSARRVDGPPGEDHRAHGDVGAAVKHDVDVHGHQGAILTRSGADAYPGGVPLGGVGQVLGALKHKAHRLAAHARQQRRVAAQHAGVVLLAAEGAAQGQGLDMQGLQVGIEHIGHGRGHIVRTLQGPLHAHATALLRYRRHRVGLQVGLLLVGCGVLPLDDDLGPGQGLLHIALVVDGPAR